MPKDWQQSKVGRNIDVLTGYPFRSESYTTSDDAVLLLRGDNVIQGKIRWDDAKRWSATNLEGIGRYWLEESDVVIAMDRTWVKAGLKVAVVQKKDLPCLLVQRVARIRASKDLDQAYVPYLFLGNDFEQHVKGVQTETAVPHISTTQIKDFQVMLPPLEEQRKIADILSTWDEAIEQQARLLALKRERKRGLMQQLLTGKVRFKEFEGLEWLHVPVNKVAREVSERNSSSDDLPVLSCTKHKGLVDSLSYFGKQVYSKDTSVYKVVRRSTFAYATNHIEEGSIGYQSLYDRGLISPMYTVFKTDSRMIDDGFLFAVLKTEHYRQVFAANMSASVDRRGSLRWKDFSKIKVPLPPLEEQQKIAAVLSAADAELDTLETQLSALRAQKRGLMQRLLTGKTRVKVDAASTEAAVLP